MSSFTKKTLRASITLAQGTFGDGLGNTKILEGLRMELLVEKSGQPSKNQMKLRIFGMLQQDMNALTTLSFKPLVVRKNLIQVEAGDLGGNLSVAFQGEITAAHASYQHPPNLYFLVEAASGYYPAIKPSTPKGFKGGADVAGLMANLASEMGYAFENSGVSGVLANPYLTGTAYQQATDVAQAANLEWGIDDGVLWIAPRGNARSGGTVPVISATTGMRSFPIYDSKGIKVETLYNPAIKYGGLVQVESEIFNGPTVWRVNAVTHHLETVKNNGHWITRIQGGPVGS